MPVRNGIKQQEDDQLVLRAANDEPEAFRTIMEKYQAPVFTLCRRITGTPQDAEDATQDTFLQLYRSLWKYQHGNGLRNWLYSIALNICRKQKRRKRIINFLSLDGLWRSDGHERTLETPSPAPSVEQAAIQREEKRLMEKLVHELPEPLKRPFVLRYFMQMPIEEIAKTLGLSAGNVRVRIHRAKMTVWTAFSRSAGARNQPRRQGAGKDD